MMAPEDLFCAFFALGMSLSHQPQSADGVFLLPPYAGHGQSVNICEKKSKS
jgi:hypothetical protein